MADSIFPELSPRSALFERVGLIEKAWLDQSCFTFPLHMKSLLYENSFFRINGQQAVFDEQKNRVNPIDMSSGFLPAAYHQGMPLYYGIYCSNGCVTVLMGTRKAQADDLAALLFANPGADLFDRMPDAGGVNPKNFPNCGCLTGIPDAPGRSRSKAFLEEPEKSLLLGHLILGLLGEEWMYLVQALPIPRSYSRNWLEQCAREIKDTKVTYGLREIQKADRMAEYYVQVLEKTIGRLKSGTHQGLWQTGVYLFSKERTTLTRAGTLLSSIFSGDCSEPEPVRFHACAATGNTSPFINGYNSKEALRLMGLPGIEFQGFKVVEQPQFDVHFQVRSATSISLGSVTVHGQPNRISCNIPVDMLTRHSLVAGVTGSGKTNTIFHILKTLDRDQRVPFLVIEPAKSEYRRLLKGMDNLLVFTLGEERPGVSAPFRLNPFWFPDGVSLQTHLDYLKAVFNTSFVMYAPMPYVLDECLYKIYEDKGWNMVSSANSRGRTDEAFPTLTELYEKIDPVVDHLGYQDKTTMDIRAALKTRIRNLCLGGKGMMLNTHHSISFSEIMKKPVILELKYMGNDEEKTFLMGLILTMLYEHYESQGADSEGSGEHLRHLTVIEEAHRLLKNVPTEKSSEEQSNIKGKGVETFCNLLAETRAFGEGILVSEQIPSKLAPDVMKNTGMKIMHRMTARDDRDLMGDTMNMDFHQKRHAASLAAGEAIFFCEEQDRPMKIRVPLTDKQQVATTGNQAVYRAMNERFYRALPGLLQKFAGCADCPHQNLDSCEKIYRKVEELGQQRNMRTTSLQFFLPYLLAPDRGGELKHLVSVFEASWVEHEKALHCLACQLIEYYLNARGGFYHWNYAFLASLRANSQGNIREGKFAAMIGAACRKTDMQEKILFDECRNGCPFPCLTGYECMVLAEDVSDHNQLMDIIYLPADDPMRIPKLIQHLVELIKEYLPEEQSTFIGPVAVCYLIHKLNELKWHSSLQRWLIDSVVRQLPEQTG